MKRLIPCAVCAFILLAAAAGAAPPTAGWSPPSSEVKSCLDALKNACAEGDEAGIARAAGGLRAAWGDAPDFDAIAGAALDRGADPKYRWIMIDSLVLYKRGVEDAAGARALLSMLDAVSWAGGDDAFVRAKALTVEAGMIALFSEKGLIRERARREFGRRLAALMEEERDAGLLAAACIAAGRAGTAEAAPAMRRRLADDGAAPAVRRTAAGALGRLNDRESIPVIAGVLEKTPDRRLHGSGAFALGSMGGEEVVEPLVRHAGRFDNGSCANALRRNRATVRRMLDDGKGAGTENAIRAARIAGMKDALPRITALENDARPGVRRAAREARDALNRALGDPFPGGEPEGGEVKP